MNTTALPSLALPQPSNAPLRRGVLFLIGTVLVLDAVWLMGQGLFSFGVTLPCAVGVAFVLLAVRWMAVQHWLLRRRWRGWLWRLEWTGFVLWLLSVLLFSAVLVQAQGGPSGDARPPTAIVVLGSGTPNGKASPTLLARLHVFGVFIH